MTKATDTIITMKILTGRPIINVSLVSFVLVSFEVELELGDKSAGALDATDPARFGKVSFHANDVSAITN